MSYVILIKKYVMCIWFGIHDTKIKEDEYTPRRENGQFKLHFLEPPEVLVDLTE